MRSKATFLIFVKADHHDKRDRHFAPRRLHPGKSAGMSQSWVKLISTSSTSRLSPMMLNLTLQSSGTRPTK
jgi:hypothetical protein